MLLSLAIWIPMVAGVLVLVLGERYARWTALVGSILGFLVTLPLYWSFDASSSAMQFVEFGHWIERFNVNYHLGVDGISVLFVLLNSFITVLAVIASWSVIESRVAQYYAAFLILSGMLNGVFEALDAVLFYVFFEGTLIPMFIIIGVWGGPNRVYASVKFFLYTLMGSLLMLVALLYLYGKSGGSFAILDWHKLPLPLGAQLMLFFGFLLAFAVKVPMWPVHTWLPDAHTEAPTAGSVVLAAILLKLGAYGFLRFSLPIMPDASRHLAWLMIALSVVAVVYIGFVALAQTDMKRLIAYSSISHMGLVTLGFFIFNDYGGVVNTMPKFASLMMLFAMANSGLPATSGFVGEFLVILGAMKTGFWLAFLAASTMVLGAAYTLWMYKRVMFGPVANPQVAALKDLNGREATVLGMLALAVLGMGVYPFPFTEVMHASVNDLLRHVALPKT